MRYKDVFRTLKTPHCGAFFCLLINLSIVLFSALKSLIFAPEERATSMVRGTSNVIEQTYVWWRGLHIKQARISPVDTYGFL